MSADKPSVSQLSANTSYNHVILSVLITGVGNRLHGASYGKENNLNILKKRIRGEKRIIPAS